ncbi:MAG: nucleotidyltransferase domain-containing protein, partial [Candidatus Electrothrix sp. AR3]|nr:nucleotidyltransferase domain-containing protein [Candidatus Electrothrix sp. AR3]
WQNFSSIIAVWSFGSAQDGNIAQGSDLDLAILFADPPDFELLCRIRADLQDVLQVDAVDLMNLNSAGVISAMEAISGTPLFCRNSGKRAEFVSLTARQYEDDMIQLRRYYSADSDKTTA